MFWIHAGLFSQASWKSNSFFCHPNPHWFLQPEVLGIYLSSTGTLGCVLWPGVGMTCSQGIPPDVYPPRVIVGLPFLPPLPLCTTPCLLLSTPFSLSPSFLSIWMNVASLYPWLSDFHTARFFDYCRCYLFWDLVVILSMVAREGETCLPMPPSWPKVLSFCSF